MNIVVDEDQSVDLTLLSFDPEGDDVSYSYSMPNYGQLTGDAPNLLYIPNPDFNGVDSFDFIASDFNSESITETVSINVISVNDIPTAESINFNVSGENLTFDISDYISDADNDLLYIYFEYPRYVSIVLENSNIFSTCSDCRDY